MKALPWPKILISTLMALAIVSLISPAEVALAQDASPPEDQELVRIFAPALYFHPDEMFRPQPVDVMVNTARLRQELPYWFDINVLPRVSISDLQDHRDGDYNLDAWLGDEGSSDYKNYSAHRDHYRSALSPEAGGPPIVTYAHVVRDENPQHITIQYWLFYYYNDWFNKHEGDWELVQVVLSAAGEPEWVVLSQHHGGTRRPWSAVRVEAGTHPAAYVALGSHANYFWGDESYPNGKTIGNARVEIMDHTGSQGPVVPDVILIPGREEIEADPAAWPGMEWLLFSGRWGELAPHSDFSGPRGPADKGDQWERPYAWGMVQPPDTGEWYKNRLRVEVDGVAPGEAQVLLADTQGGALRDVEELGNLALLHTDPPPGATIRASIEVPPGLHYDLLAVWPDAETSQVTRYRFEDVSPDASGRAVLLLRADEPAALIYPEEVQPTKMETKRATWIAPDVVWVIGLLSASDVVKGVAISLLAGLLPALLYTGALYWADRYEKEPIRLLAAAFLWGAVPALLVAAVTGIFLRLPVDLLGPAAIEAVRAGLVTPLIEEALKSGVIIFIAWRYRREFDNVLDGIIYGAMVGLGFTMTGNTLSYLGAFLLQGFEGLSSTIFIEGILYGLNHALYSAIFGAGLGYARLMQQRRERWIVRVMAFVLAVAGHALHNLALYNAVGLNLLTVTVTWAGVLVIVVVACWSLERQRRCIAAELAGEVPDALHRTLAVRGGRNRARWRALRQEGLRGWLRVRYVHQQCAELAFKKMQHRQRPDEVGLREEIERLRKKVKALVNGEA